MHGNVFLSSKTPTRWALRAVGNVERLRVFSPCAPPISTMRFPACTLKAYDELRGSNGTPHDTRGKVEWGRSNANQNFASSSSSRGGRYRPSSSERVPSGRAFEMKVVKLIRALAADVAIAGNYYSSAPYFPLRT
uniref:Uncharacterized protein n=1 Tax=Trypanosoma congolense (strain IL3000) TaxID=1068625 RepID=G0UMG6_TRYCI|nr:hypothetical protein, unlikely [Trypanosoma congolense IL3000]